jgi:hypothetical protein
MPIRWRPPGDGMGTVDLRDFGDDQIVIHFGGAATSVDAYTFANALVAFADTVRSVNGAINRENGIEVRLEAIGPGSFRAVIKRLSKGLRGFFADGATRIFWGLIAALIFDKLIRSDPSVNITVTTDEVVIQKGHDRIIIPRSVYDHAQHLRSNSEVQRHLSRTFHAIENDEAVENFGLTPRITDTVPVVQIPKAEFSRLATPAPIEGEPGRRKRTEPVRLVILKLWLTQSTRKWSFEWNGVPISAPIKDADFWRRLEARELLIGHGDALDVELAFDQIYDPNLGVWLNDPQTYSVSRVLAHVPRIGGEQRRLID